MNSVIENPRTYRNLPPVFVIPRQHPEHTLHILPRHVPERVSPVQNVHHLIHTVPVACRHGHQMLGKHIEAHSWLRMLHSAKSGGLSRHAAVDTLRCRPRIHVHHADRPRIMTCPAQTLHRAGHCTGTANLKDLVNVSHIDPELHGRCRAKKPEPSFPQFLLHLRKACPAWRRRASDEPPASYRSVREARR